METACPSCGKRYKVADQAAGKRAQCAACKHVFVVQAAAATPPGGPMVAGPVSGQPTPGRPAGAVPSPGASSLPPIESSPLDDLLSAEIPQAAPLAPAPMLPPVRRRARRDWQKPVLYGGIAAGGLLLMLALIVGLVSLVSGVGGGPGAALAEGGALEWGGWAMPGDGTGIAYVNVDKLRGSDLSRLMEKAIKAGGGPTPIPKGPWGSTPWKVLTENFTEIFVALTAAQQPVVVFRTRDDMDLKTFADLMRSGPAKSGDPASLSHAGVDYVSFSDGFAAKTGSRTFCVADHEEDLQGALDRVRANQKASLSSELRHAVECARGDHFLAMVIPEASGSGSPRPPGMGAGSLSPPKWVGIGFSVDSSLAIDGALGFPSEQGAAAIKKQYDQTMAQMREAESQMAKLPPQMRQSMQKAVNMMRALRLSQSGNTLRVSGEWDLKDFESLMDQAQGVRPPTPF